MASYHWEYPRIGIAIGSLTFTGSVVAAGKLHELIPGKPIVLPQRWLLNVAALAGSAVMTGDVPRKIPREFFVFFWGVTLWKLDGFFEWKMLETPIFTWMIWG